MMTTLTITLPHTPRCLSPNAKAPLTQRGPRWRDSRRRLPRAASVDKWWGEEPQITITVQEGSEQ